MKPKISIKL